MNRNKRNDINENDEHGINENEDNEDNFFKFFQTSECVGGSLYATPPAVSGRLTIPRQTNAKPHTTTLYNFERTIHARTVQNAAVGGSRHSELRVPTVTVGERPR